MSSKLYDQMWSEALQDFLDLYQEEFKPYDQVSAPFAFGGCVSADAKKRSAVKKPAEWLQFYANLYISYIQLYKKVEDVYDQFVHPQKIAIVRSILDNCIMRLHEIRKDLVMFNVGTKALNSDFVNFDELLFEKKILPEKLEIPVPRYLRQDTPALRDRDNMVFEYLKREDRHLPEEEVLEVRNPVETDVESDIWEILKNERGRQGIIHAQQKRAQQIANLKKKKKKDVPEVKADVEGSLIVQKYLRAFIDRKEIERMRREEEEFLGIKIPMTDMANVPKLRKLDRGAEDLDTLVAAVRAERKGKQHTAANELEVVTHKVRKEIVDHETPDMKENLLQKMRTWITEYYEQHEGKELPDKIEDFYKKDDKAKPLTKEEEDAKKKADAEKEKAAKKAADDKKKGKMTEEEAFKEARAARGPDNSRPLRVLNEEVQKYLDEWVSRGDTTAGAARPNKELIIREVQAPSHPLSCLFAVVVSAASQFCPRLFSRSRPPTRTSRYTCP